MSGPRRRRPGLRRQRVARAVADCFLAAALQQQPFLQAFGCVAIHAMVQPAALFRTVGLLILGCRSLARRVLRLRRNGRRHKNCQGNRERPEVNGHVRILRGRAHLRIPALPEPRPRRILAREVEVLHLRVDEMVCNVRHDIRDSAVRDNRNFLYSLKMLLEELQVSNPREVLLGFLHRSPSLQHLRE